jgi:hypothetical protein
MPIHRYFSRAWLSVLILPVLLLLTSVPAAATARAQAPPAPPAPATPAIAKNCSPLPLDRKDFPDRPRINNRFLPYVPGTQFFLDGSVILQDGKPHAHRIETTVTDLTKVIDGVRTMVVFDVDIQDHKVIESELFFVAQDGDGTVWTLGEYPEEYDRGKLAGAPRTWISGLAGARAGIAMLAKPRVGTPTFLQGLAPKVQFKDCATVFKTGQRTCVPVHCFNDVLVTDEFAPLDPAGGHQRKSFAPGVGTIKVAAAGGVDPEALQLTKAAKLCPAEFAKVREQALKQDHRGYTVSKDVYAKTPTAQQSLEAETCY